MFAAIEVRARDALRRGAAGLIGGVCVLVGLGFLTHAAWLALSGLRDPLFAAQVIGGAYVLVGGVFLLRARRRRVIVPVTAPLQPVSHLMLVEAFLVGLDAARSTRGSRPAPGPVHAARGRRGSEPGSEPGAEAD